MKRASFLKCAITLLILSLTIPNVSCTKEKAEAIKNSAEQFRVESKAAVEMVRNLTRLSLPTGKMDRSAETESLANEFKTVPPDRIGDFVDSKIGRPDRFRQALDPIEQELKRMEESYDLFASMYTSLPRGNFFAKDEVKRSHRYAVKLTLQMINFADGIAKAPFTFDGRRRELRAKFSAAKSLADPVASSKATLLASQDLIQLREDETKANEATILQCLKAAETGKLVTELVARYDSLTVGDMLDLTKNALNIISDVTGGNGDVKAAISRLESFRDNKIRTDPLWNDVQTTEIRRSLITTTDTNR